MKIFKYFVPIATFLSVLFILSPLSTQAGNYTLTNNTDSRNSVFYISGEQTLVMNGFDLQPRNIPRPTTLDRVSIDVVTAVPNSPIEVVVYQDADGGDPINATLVGRQTVQINEAGLFTVTFSQPLTITAPVIWVGFYLPPGFEFNADRSGSSVLTYWAWTPNSTFDLNNLRSAQVFGPGNGNTPVEINMGGIARITAELITSENIPQTTATPTVPVTSTTPGRLDATPKDTAGRIVQAVGDPNTSLAPMIPYPTESGCQLLYYDSQDVGINLRASIFPACKTAPISLSPDAPAGYRIRGTVTYDVTYYGLPSPNTNPPDYPVTHCLSLAGSELDRAVLGVAHGTPHQWEILPTIRFGSMICADVYNAGPITYFVPN
jgi:hypothetical protein